MAVASPIKLGKTSIFRSPRKKISKPNQNIVSISGLLFRKTKFRRDSIAQTDSLRRQRMENEDRAEREAEAEADNSVKTSEGRLRTANNAGGSFLDRIIGFIGYTALGWFLNNIPTWIGIGKEFIARLKKAGEIISSITTDVINIISGFGNVFTAIGKNIMSFDIFDNSKNLENALGDLNSSFSDLHKQFKDGFDLIKVPLTEGKYSGEDVPDLGTPAADQGAYPETQAPSGGGNGVLNPQQGYAYLRQLGVPHIHALGILANIAGESDFRIGVSEKGGPGVGLFQYSDSDRKPRFLNAVPDYKTNWKAQIKYAIGEDRGPEYLKRQFSSPEEAAYWWMDKWERPSGAEYTKRNNKHNAFIKSFKPGSASPAQTARPSAPTSPLSQVASNQVSSGTITAPQGFRPTFTQGTTGRSTGPHFHFGPGTASNKKAQQGNKFPGLFYSDTRDVAFNVAKYFLGQKKSFLLSRSGRWIYPGITDSQLKNAIMTEQQVHTQKGSDGGIDMAFADNVKLPLAVSEVSDRGDGFGISGTISGTNVFVGHGDRGSTSSSSGNVVSQAQISSSQSSSSQISAITPERRGQDIIITSPNTTQSTPTPSRPASAEMPMIPDESSMLNNFIKNKLLLDLAYL